MSGTGPTSWQGDDTHYLLADGPEVRIINIVDDHSRLDVDSLAVAWCRSERVWESFCRGAGRHGVPAEFLNDNGRAYLNRPGEHPVLFQAHLARLGVAHLHSSPYHPQTCGKVERFHQTQRRWLNAQPRARTVAELQELLDGFRSVYNHTRPHRALARRTPAEVWAAQMPATPARAAAESPVLLTAGQAGANGNLEVGRGLTIALGVQWAHQHLTVVRRGLATVVIDTRTGEIARELVVDPTRRYQPTGRPRGGRRLRRRDEDVAEV